MNISAKIIAHSASVVDGKEIITFELDYPRYIHAEVMTHRVFSRNAASSRAIPTSELVRLVREERVYPLEWRANQKGMQPGELLDESTAQLCRELWDGAGDFIASKALALSEAGLHKQWVNRILEPFQYIKTILTTTEMGNFFHLRRHPDAQIEIKALAECMYQALQQSTAEVLHPGEWHTPYVSFDVISRGHFIDLGPEKDQKWITIEEALKISASCCAQVSYRKSDDSLEKALLVYDRLVESKPVHASPFEHQGSPMRGVDTQEPDGWQFLINHSGYPGSWEVGITHSDRDGRLWSGNFKSWIQYRQMIKDNVCWEYPVGVQDEE